MKNLSSKKAHALATAWWAAFFIAGLVIQACNPPSSAVRVRSNSEAACLNSDADACREDTTTDAADGDNQTRNAPNKKIIEIWKTISSASTSDSIEIRWQSQDGAASYGLTIGFEETCESKLLSIDGITENKYSINIASAGSYHICVDAFDGSGKVIGNAHSSYELTVTGSANPPFAWASLIGDYNLPVGFTNNRIALATGGSGTTVYSIDTVYSTCQLQSWPTPLTINSNTGVLSGVAATQHIGKKCDLRIIAQNESSAIFQSLKITVTSGNSKPTLVLAVVSNTGAVTGDGSSGNPFTFTVDEDTTIGEAAFSGTDPNPSDVLRVSCASAPSFVESSTADAKIIFKPVNTHANQNFTFSCALTDSYELSDDLMYFDITVNNVNSAPVLAYLGQSGIGTVSGAGTLTDPKFATLTEDAVGLEILLSATDPDPTGDTVTISCTGTASSMVTVDNVNDKLLLAPLNANVGSSLLTCKGNDGTLDSNNVYFSFVVLNTNDAPSIAYVSNQNLAGFYGAGTIGSPYIVNVLSNTSNSYIQLSATDPDVGQNPSISCSGIPAWASANSGTKRINFTSASSTHHTSFVSFNCKANDGTADSSLIYFQARLVKAAGNLVWEYTDKYNNRVDVVPSNLSAIAEDSLGRIYFAGLVDNYSHSSSREVWFVRRYSSAGVLDSGYEITESIPQGKYTVSILSGIAIDSSDNLIIAGCRSNSDASSFISMIQKYDSSGQLLWSYNGSINQTYLGPALDSSDRIYFAYSSGATGYIKRLNSDGTLDSAYNASISASNFTITSIAANSAGELHVASYGNNLVNGTSGQDWSIKKFDSSGVEITTGWNKALNHSNNYDQPLYAQIDAGGKLWVIGHGYNIISGYDLVVYAFNAAGTQTNNYTKDDDPFSPTGGYKGKYFVDSSSNLYFVIDVSGDFVLRKYNGSGTTQWTKTINTLSGSSNNADYGRGVYVSSTGVVLTAGTTTAIDTYVLRAFDSSGNEDTVNWNKKWTFGLHAKTVVQAAVADAQDNIYLAGWGKGLASATSNNDWFIKKLDKNGNEITSGWDKVIDSGGADVASSIAIDASGNIAVAGSGTNLVNGSSALDAWIKVFDNSGNEIPAREVKLDIDTLDGFGKIQFDAAGNLHACYRNATTGAITVYKYNTSGALSGSFTSAITTFTGCADMTVDASGNTYICSSLFNQLYLGSQYDFYVGKFDNTGSLIWNEITDLGSAGRCSKMSVQSDGSVLAYGTGYNLAQTVSYLIKLSNTGVPDTSNWGSYLFYNTGGGRGLVVPTFPTIRTFISEFQTGDSKIYQFNMNGEQNLGWNAHIPNLAPSYYQNGFGDLISLSTGDLVSVGGGKWQPSDLYEQEGIHVTLISAP